MKTSARVYLREENTGIYVKLTGADKPAITDRIINHWQKIINVVARILNKPAGLIMKITPETMEVFLASQTEGNPYQPGGSDTLGHGLYCETVIGRDEPLIVEDALSDPVWKENPDVKLNMISYLGMPLKWPDGEVFGTICVLDNKKSTYNEDYLDLLGEFRGMIEADLERELRDRDLIKAESVTELRLKELHHRMKNQFTIISSLIQLKADETEENTRKILEEIDGKIRSVALLHSKIYESANLHTSISGYIEDVIKTSLQIYKADVSLEVKIDEELDYDMKCMLDFGILFSELVTNSIKYGMPRKSGKISLSITKEAKEDRELYRIRYKDNGPGFPQEVLEGNGKEGVGTIITNIFASKFEGTVRKYNDEGAVVEFELLKPGPSTDG